MPGFNGERRVFIGKLSQRLRHERFARDLAHGAEDVRVHNAAGLEVGSHHESAVTGVDVAAIRSVSLNGHSVDDTCTKPGKATLIPIIRNQGRQPVDKERQSVWAPYRSSKVTRTFACTSSVPASMGTSLLNAEWFATPRQAQAVISQWLRRAANMLVTSS